MGGNSALKEKKKYPKNILKLYVEVFYKEKRAISLQVMQTALTYMPPTVCAQAASEKGSCATTPTLHWDQVAFLQSRTG